MWSVMWEFMVSVMELVMELVMGLVMGMAMRSVSSCHEVSPRVTYLLTYRAKKFHH